MDLDTKNAIGAGDGAGAGAGAGAGVVYDHLDLLTYAAQKSIADAANITVLRVNKLEVRINKRKPLKACMNIVLSYE